MQNQDTQLILYYLHKLWKEYQAKRCAAVGGDVKLWNYADGAVQAIDRISAYVRDIETAQGK